eukprot:TRINITY_DN23133_c0_g1_i1.p1 TRINITY_DN23133_c0_g1~~TRINITY_DN23133_c0_g1_i1.p1  ORF type:complete len:251 (-),score=39.82 TRINITY_DN23133_c0_g1_i1:712-1377(-)
MAQYLQSGIRSLDKVHRSASEAHLMAEQPHLLENAWALQQHHIASRKRSASTASCSSSSSGSSRSTTCSWETSSQRSNSCSSVTSSMRSRERKNRSVTEAQLAGERAELNDEMPFALQHMRRLSRPTSNASSRPSSRSSGKTKTLSVTSDASTAAPTLPKTEKKQVSDYTLAVMGEFGKARPMTHFWRPVELTGLPREDGLPACPKARSKLMLDRLGGMLV